VIPNAVAVINGKGGTGKTSVVANVAGLAAAAGYQVLTVDLDPQGNLGRDLGYLGQGGKDASAAPLMAALSGHVLLDPISGTRPRLDSVAGGEELEDWAPLASSWRSRGRHPESALEAALGGVARRYNLILIDCPPGNRELQLLAMYSAQFAVIPTKPDEASFDGMIRVARLFETVRGHNPGLGLLGVILFGIESRAHRVRSETREQVQRELGDADLVFTAEIRHLLAPARDARARGQLLHEYEENVLAAPKFYEPGGRTERLAASAPGLAGDYQAVTRELLGRMQAAAREAVPA
jgi:chromosome partitioning protein